MGAVSCFRGRAVLCACIGIASLGLPSRAEEPRGLPETDKESTAHNLSEAFRNAADRASPALVSVYSMRGPRMTARWRQREASRHGHFMSNDKRPTGPLSSRSRTDDQGSGIVIDSDGTILTCNHLVAAADALMVVLPDGSTFEPVTVFSDPTADLALIRIQGAGELANVDFGDSDALQMGDWVVTLANPYELKHSLSAGVVGSTNRWVPGTHHPLIQYDASTNPGSSGGALLNLRGEVVGIITGSFGQSESFQGIGLAVPMSVVKRSIEQMRDPKKSQHAYYGWQTKALSPVVAKQLGLPVAGGLYVEDVEHESPAARAGIEEGDVITHSGDQPLDAHFDPTQLYENRVSGEKHYFTLFRAGKAIEVNVRIDVTEDRNGALEHHEKRPQQHTSDYFDDRLGLGLDELVGSIARELGFPEDTRGALISYVEIGSPAYKEGIAAGMIVVRMNESAIRDLDRYKQVASTSPRKSPLLMLIETNEGKHLVVFEDIRNATAVGH
jgi:serine protease Do